MSLRAAVTLLLALSATLVEAGPEWRQRADGEQAAQRLLNHAQRLASQQPAMARRLLLEGAARHAPDAMGPTLARHYARALVALGESGAARQLLRRQRRALPRWPAVAVAALQRRGPEPLARRVFRDFWQRRRLADDLRQLTPSAPEVP